VAFSAASRHFINASGRESVFLWRYRLGAKVGRGDLLLTNSGAVGFSAVVGGGTLNVTSRPRSILNGTRLVQLGSFASSATISSGGIQRHGERPSRREAR
jgi:hypothetical protein